MSAVVFGGMFVSATFWLYHDLVPEPIPEPLASYFLWSYFQAVVVFFVPLLLDAFVLRRLAMQFHWTNVWVWVVAGAAIFVCVQWTLAAPIRWLAAGRDTGILLTLMSGGPSLLLEKPFWLWPIPGLTTAYVLFLVYRAFELQSSVSPPA